MCIVIKIYSLIITSMQVHMYYRKLVWKYLSFTSSLFYFDIDNHNIPVFFVGPLLPLVLPVLFSLGEFLDRQMRIVQFCIQS